MFKPPRIKHCRVCGTEVNYRVPADDNRERAVCQACGEIHYVNPLNVVGTVPVWGEQVLLCRRNIEPRFGFWTLPAGFMENDETTAEAAARETAEEACARIEVGAFEQGLGRRLRERPAGADRDQTVLGLDDIAVSGNQQ